MSGLYRHCERCNAEMPSGALSEQMFGRPRHYLCSECNKAFDEWVKAGLLRGERPAFTIMDELLNWQLDAIADRWRTPANPEPESGYAIDSDGDVWVRQPNGQWNEPGFDRSDSLPWAEVADGYGPMVELKKVDR